jgi:MFS family permease
VFLSLGLGLMGMTYGPLGTILSELFPPEVRYTGASLTFNLAGILGASLAPYIATWLATNYGLQYVGYYLSGAAVISALGGAPVMLNTASTLPTRSTTTITAGLLCACASATAWAMTLRTSSSLRKDDALPQKPLQPCPPLSFPGGGAVPVVLFELLPPPQAVRATQKPATSQRNCDLPIAFPSKHLAVRHGADDAFRLGTSASIIAHASLQLTQFECGRLMVAVTCDASARHFAAAAFTRMALAAIGNAGDQQVGGDTGFLRGVAVLAGHGAVLGVRELRIDVPLAGHAHR